MLGWLLHRLCPREHCVASEEIVRHKYAINALVNENKALRADRARLYREVVSLRVELSGCKTDEYPAVDIHDQTS
jgi:hypothetical protein